MNDMLNKLKEAVAIADSDVHVAQINWGNLAGESIDLENRIESVTKQIGELEEHLANAKNTVEVLSNLLRANARQLETTGDRVKLMLKAKQDLDRIMARLEPKFDVNTLDDALHTVPDNIAAE